MLTYSRVCPTPCVLSERAQGAARPGRTFISRIRLPPYQALLVTDSMETSTGSSSAHAPAAVPLLAVLYSGVRSSDLLYRFSSSAAACGETTAVSWPMSNPRLQARVG